MRSTLFVLGSIAGSLALGTLAPQAQPVWDPNALRELMREGDQLYAEGMALDPGAEAEQRQLFLRSLEAKDAALEMLLAAIESGEVRRVDNGPFSTRPDDLFVLTESVSVLQIVLGECEAAARTLKRALDQSELLVDSGAVELLESLLPEVGACVERRARDAASDSVP